jgi:hypothetical protein
LIVVLPEISISILMLSATSTSHTPREVIFGIAGVVFIFMALGLLMMEILRLVFGTAERDRQSTEGPVANYLGHAHSVLAGPPMKVLRKRALTVMAISAVVGLVAFLL